MWKPFQNTTLMLIVSFSSSSQSSGRWVPGFLFSDSHAVQFLFPCSHIYFYPGLFKGVLCSGSLQWACARFPPPLVHSPSSCGFRLQLYRNFKRLNWASSLSVGVRVAIGKEELAASRLVCATNTGRLSRLKSRLNHVLSKQHHDYMPGL